MGSPPINCYNNPPILSCCDLFGNEAGDYVGCIADQYGIRGNISADPLFCDPANGEFGLEPESPCAPFSDPNPECDRLGAWPVGCDPAAVESGSGQSDHPWGSPHPGTPGTPGAQDTWLDLGVDLTIGGPQPITERARLGIAVTPRLASGAQVTLQVLDAQGRVCSIPFQGTLLPGAHEVTWDTRDGTGRRLPAGIYLVRLLVGTSRTGPAEHIALIR